MSQEYVGRVFARRGSQPSLLRVLAVHVDQWPGDADSGSDITAYSAIECDEHGRPTGKQRRRIMARTIDAKYRPTGIEPMPLSAVVKLVAHEVLWTLCPKHWVYLGSGAMVLSCDACQRQHHEACTACAEESER